MITIKSQREIEIMRRAGHITGKALAAAGAAVRPGVTTMELNDIAHRVIVKAGARPSFLGYNKFPASVCVSVNDELIHGIPGRRKLAEGDIVSIDVGAYLNGYHGDSAATFAVGRISDEARLLIENTRLCFFKAAERARRGLRVSDISRTIQQTAENAGYGVVKKWTGHGIGRALHEAPDIPCFTERARGALLSEGMTLAIEPMLSAGSGDVDVADDNTTVITVDRKLCAHYEHTVLVTRDGYELLTYIEGLSV
ncbi:MAG: type I methionyl aminopeptidase [Oscillospiraceae bacterium]|nr:type I methionyl aminopeptidase [Oscillospiraceae bacterium]